MPENVLLLTVDSFRFDHFPPGQVDGPSLLSPFSEDALYFDSAFVTGPGTTPSFPALLTGTSPLSYGGLGPLREDRPRVSKHMKQAGLTTAGFQCNPFLSTHFNYDVGYDRFKDYQNPLMGIATKIFPRGIEINNPKLRKIDETLRVTDLIKKSYQLVKGKPRPYVSAEVITDDTIEWLEEVSKPFFCWTHYMDVHHPCYPPETYRERFDVANVAQSDVSEWYSELTMEPGELTKKKLQQLRSLYKAAIAYTVDQINRIIETLEQNNHYDNTLVVLTSDHGELFGDHNQYGKPERMYDELLHIPLLVANGPSYLADATDDLVSLLDIPPLIHHTLGLDIPEEYEGRVPGVDDPRAHIMAEHEVEGEVIVGARSEDWLYEGDQINDEHRLFDLRNGFEQVDRDHPEGATVRDAVLARLDELNVEAKYLQSDMDENVEDRLEDLGYL